MIWLLPHLLPPSSVSKLDRRHTGRLRKRDNMLTRVGGEEVGEETTRMNGHLKIIQNSLVSLISVLDLCLILNHSLYCTVLIYRANGPLCDVV
jgi:hypothetical protein